MINISDTIYVRAISLKIILSAFFLLTISSAYAQLPQLNPEQEKRAQAIDRLLMAPCCWAKTVAEDNSGQAFAVREQVRNLILAGKTDAEVLASFELEYGEKILSSPKKESFNILLWVLPFILMPLLMLLLYKIIVSWKRSSNASSDEEKNINNELKTKNEPSESSQSEEYKKYAKQLDQELYGEDS